MSRIDTFLELAVNQGGSDLHLVSGQNPRIRINGEMHRVRFRELTPGDMERILTEFMTERQRDVLDRHLTVDFAYEVEGLGRFRVNVYRHVHGMAAALRVIPPRVASLDELGLPPSIKHAVTHPKGLFLVVGPTGSGKSTTQAAIVDHINSTRRGHILTIEDPIEYVHDYKKCVITQREIGLHAPSFSEALRNAIREDPDVILVGELRDLETISLALTAAETGIQILGTLHTSGATRTIDRIVNVFPGRRQEQIRSMLADSLRMIVSQKLVRNSDGNARLAAVEILVNTHAVASMIRSGHSHKLESVIQAGGASGMQTLDAALKELVRRQVITGEEAHTHASNKSHFERYVVNREAA